jgi:HlyD family secretion protein
MSIKKIVLIVAVVVVLAAVVIGSILHSQANVTKVATAKAVRQDLTSIVSGTGQIKPKTYVNVGATAFGRITHLFVKEGDHVKKGELIATVESEQPASAVQAQQATIAASKTDVQSYIAAEKTAEANVTQAKADLEQKQFDFQRAKELYKDQLIAKQDYDAKKAAYDVSAATLQQRVASVAQAKAQTASAVGHVDQAVATLRGNSYNLGLTQSRAPFDALVTNVPVREGETVVVMSVITAEVKVDETDIVNVALNQPADVTVDALPGRVFKGHVTEVGDQALLRTTGIATSQSTTGTEEAKDFKVVVTLEDTPGAPLSELRPGLVIPIQALVQRDPAAEKVLAQNDGKPPKTVSTSTAKPQFVQGVYIVTEEHGKLRVIFTPVTTGITGATDIEVLTGLKTGDEIVIGRYKILRTLKSGTVVKRDNTPEVVSTDSSSS